jgi:hypothetical protein
MFTSPAQRAFIRTFAVQRSHRSDVGRRRRLRARVLPGQLNPSFRQLIVSAITRESESVISIRLEDPGGAQLPDAGPGQYLTYITNLAICPDGNPVTAQFVIDAYHRLFEIEKSFRMSKHDLAARPIYHHTRASIDAHLTIVFAALAAISRLIEQATGWSSASSCAPPAATAPSTSASANTCSPPKTPYPTTCARHWPTSAERLRTNLARLGTCNADQQVPITTIVFRVPS